MGNWHMDLVVSQNCFFPNTRSTLKAFSILETAKQLTYVLDPVLGLPFLPKNILKSLFQMNIPVLSSVRLKTFYGNVPLYLPAKAAVWKNPWSRIWHLSSGCCSFRPPTVNVSHSHPPAGMESRFQWRHTPTWSHIETPVHELYRGRKISLFNLSTWRVAHHLQGFAGNVLFKLYKD